MKAKKAKEAKKEIVLWKLPQIPDEKPVKKNVDTLLARAGSFEVKSEDHFLASWLIVQSIDQAMEGVEATFNPFIEALYKLHKMAIRLRDTFLDPLYAQKMRLLTLRKTFREEQEKIKREAEAKLAAGLQKQQQKDLEKQARAAERKGEKDVASLLWDQAESVPLPVLKSEPAVVQQEGSVIRRRWVFRIVNPEKVQRQYCTPDAKLIRPVVTALGPACAIEGIEVWEDVSEHSRSVNE